MQCDMKTVVHRKGILHVETPLGIVNIHVGLHEQKGRDVERVSMLPNQYAGEPKVLCVRNAFFVRCKRARG